MASKANGPATPEQIAEQFAEQFDEAIAVRVAGLAHQRAGDQRKAMACFASARETLVHLGLQAQVAWTLQNEGLVLELLGRPDEALARFTGAEALFRAADERQGWPLMFRRRGDLLRRQGRHDEALAQYDAALAQHRLDDDANGIINTLSCRADSDLARNDVQRARSDLQGALAHLRNLPRRAGEHDFLLFARIARTEAALGNRELAREHATQAHDLARELQLDQDRGSPDVAENLRRLVELER